MKPILPTVSLLYLAASTFGQYLDPIDEQARQFKANISRNPNATSSVPFALDNQEGWFWRVNITEFALPDEGYSRIGYPDNTYDFGQRAMRVEYDFRWPESTDLRQVLYEEGGEDASICHVIFPRRFPTNITDRYSSNDNGSCEKLFGSQCVKGLQAAVEGMGVRCSGLYIEDIDGCNSTFSIGTRNFDGEAFPGIGGISFNTQASNESELNASDTTRLPGDAVLSFRQTTVGQNLTQYNILLGVVHILGITKNVAGHTDSKLLCQIVSPSAAAESNAMSNVVVMNAAITTIAWTLAAVSLFVYVA